MATAATSPDFNIVTSDHSLGRNLPQRMGRILWLPMWGMAVMAFTVGFILAIARANEIADLPAGVTADDTTAALKHVVAGFMFLGFASVFASISFAIARILGEFRKGGGDVQESTGRTVQTLKMPVTAQLFIATMAMAMMAIVVAVILHFVFAADIDNTPASLKDAEERFIVLEGVRRLGIAMYLISFMLGLGTIIEVLRFQAIRIRQLPGEATRS